MVYTWRFALLLPLNRYKARMRCICSKMEKCKILSMDEAVLSSLKSVSLLFSVVDVCRL